MLSPGFDPELPHSFTRRNSYYQANEQLLDDSNDVELEILQSAPAKQSRDGKPLLRALTYMQVDEALESRRLKQRYLVKTDDQDDKVQGDILLVDGESIRWTRIQGDAALHKEVEALNSFTPQAMSSQF